MIIFDLDGTLADCEHRRHFVDINKNIIGGYDQARLREGWKPDWQAFYEACDKDTLIRPIAIVITSMFGHDYYDNSHDLHIWSGRCESVRRKTEKWLEDNYIEYNSLKMRPKGDYTPDDQLKESWLNEALKEGHTIDFVFDDRTKVVDMYRRRGIFVFDVNQTGKEF